MAAGLVLAYLDRHRVPASLTGWDFYDVLSAVTNMAVPVVGFVLGFPTAREPRRLAVPGGGPGDWR